VTSSPPAIVIRPTSPGDWDGIVALSRAVYPDSPPWTRELLASHLEIFPEGQLVAVLEDERRVVGMAASLVITWDDYHHAASWRTFTAAGTFRNHDPHGRTLYGAEVMVDPTLQRRRIGKRLYGARRALAQRLGVLRIRAGARLRGYGRYAARMTAEEYTLAVLHGAIKGPTLSFQLREGFRVFGVVEDYLAHDPESLGWAALIEWLNPAIARPEDSAARDPKWDAVLPERPPHRRATPS